MTFIIATTGNDSLTGTLENDYIYGLSGDDYLSGDNGNDLLNGGDGNDTLDGGIDGNNILYGGGGDDTLSDGTLIDGSNDHLLDGGEGNDYIYSIGGNGTLNGGDGDDSIYSIGGNETLNGGDGDDTLSTGGFNGNKSLNGGDGNDFLLTFNISSFTSPYAGVNQIDTLTGGAGTDTFAITYSYDDGDPLAAGITNYALIKDFQPNQDFLQLTGDKSNYFLAASPVVPITVIFFDKPGAEPDELVATVENVSNLNLNDSYFIESGNDFFSGTSGADGFNGGEGNDELSGLEGNDFLLGGNGNDALYGANGNDLLNGGNGDDYLLGSYNRYGTSEIGEIDTLTGGAGRDIFVLGARTGFEGSVLSILYDDLNTTTAGTSDYAIINDFDSSLDVIQLVGTPANYILVSSPGITTGTGIYVDKPDTEPDELIAVLQGVESSSLSLTAPYFSYFG